MIKAFGYAAKHSFSRLRSMQFDREEAGASDVEIEVMFCGVCHSDIHQVKNEWSNTVYPCMPGHEIVGRVTEAGDACRAGDQNYCEGPNSWLATYNGPMVPAKKAPDGHNSYERDNTFGGYSSVVVVREDFVLKIPAALKPEVAAPILCAGVTTYSPMKHWGVKAGDHVGIIGFGGLGNMAAKLALAMGAKVTLFTTTKEKLDEAAKLGAQGVLESDAEALKGLKASFDLMLSTIPEKHDLNPFMPLLKRDKSIVVVGALEPLAPVNNQEMAFFRKSIGGSLIGNLADTQEVLDFCAEHSIGPDIQVIPIGQINDAYKDVEKGDVRFRYVIDMSTLEREA